MATYLPGVTDKLSAHQTWTPDFAFYQGALNQKQQTYDQGWSKLNNIYNSVLNSPMMRDENIANRDEFFKNIESDLKSASKMDLSLQQNVTKATNIFKPIYENKNIAHDMYYTKQYGNKMSMIQGLKNCVDKEKCGDKYWAGGVEAMQIRAKKYTDSSQEDALNFAGPTYVNKVNVYDRAQKIAKAANLSVTKDRSNGKYIVTDTNGVLIQKPLMDLFMGQIGSQDDVQSYYREKAFLLGERDPENLESVYNSIMASRAENEPPLEVEKVKSIARKKNEDENFEFSVNEIKSKHAGGIDRLNDMMLVKNHLNSEKNKGEKVGSGLEKINREIEDQEGVNNVVGGMSESIDRLDSDVSQAQKQSVIANQIMLMELQTAAESLSHTGEKHTQKADPYRLASYKSGLALNNQLTVAQWKYDHPDLDKKKDSKFSYSNPNSKKGKVSTTNYGQAESDRAKVLGRLAVKNHEGYNDPDGPLMVELRKKHPAMIGESVAIPAVEGQDVQFSVTVLPPTYTDKVENGIVVYRDIEGNEIDLSSRENVEGFLKSTNPSMYSKYVSQGFDVYKEFMQLTGRNAIVSPSSASSVNSGAEITTVENIARASSGAAVSAGNMTSVVSAVDGAIASGTIQKENKGKAIEAYETVNAYSIAKQESDKVISGINKTIENISKSKRSDADKKSYISTLQNKIHKEEFALSNKKKQLHLELNSNEAYKLMNESGAGSDINRDVDNTMSKMAKVLEQESGSVKHRTEVITSSMTREASLVSNEVIRNNKRSFNVKNQVVSSYAHDLLRVIKSGDNAESALGRKEASNFLDRVNHRLLFGEDHEDLTDENKIELIASGKSIQELNEGRVVEYMYETLTSKTDDGNVIGYGVNSSNASIKKAISSSYADASLDIKISDIATKKTIDNHNKALSYADNKNREGLKGKEQDEAGYTVAKGIAKYGTINKSGPIHRLFTEAELFKNAVKAYNLNKSTLETNVLEQSLGMLSDWGNSLGKLITNDWSSMNLDDGDVFELFLDSKSLSLGGSDDSFVFGIDEKIFTDKESKELISTYVPDDVNKGHEAIKKRNESWDMPFGDDKMDLGIQSALSRAYKAGDLDVKINGSEMTLYFPKTKLKRVVNLNESFIEGRVEEAFDMDDSKDLMLDIHNYIGKGFLSADTGVAGTLGGLGGQENLQGEYMFTEFNTTTDKGLAGMNYLHSILSDAYDRPSENSFGELNSSKDDITEFKGLMENDFSNLSKIKMSKTINHKEKAGIKYKIDYTHNGESKTLDLKYLDENDPHVRSNDTSRYYAMATEIKKSNSNSVHIPIGDGIKPAVLSMTHNGTMIATYYMLDREGSNVKHEIDILENGLDETLQLIRSSVTDMNEMMRNSYADKITEVFNK